MVARVVSNHAASPSDCRLTADAAAR